MWVENLVLEIAFGDAGFLSKGVYAARSGRDFDNDHLRCFVVRM